MLPPPPSVVLRDATASDESCRLRLFASTREAELTALPPAVHASFVESQFRLWTQAVRAAYPDARHRLVLEAAEPIGALVTHDDGEAVHLVDVALLPAHRGHGLGTALLHRVIAEAGPRPVRLRVTAHNPARRLYERLGFRYSSPEGVHLTMERLSGALPAAHPSEPPPYSLVA